MLSVFGPKAFASAENLDGEEDAAKADKKKVDEEVDDVGKPIGVTDHVGEEEGSSEEDKAADEEPADKKSDTEEA
jgi:hypothetical protein